MDRISLFLCAKDGARRVTPRKIGSANRHRPTKISTARRLSGKVKPIGNGCGEAGTGLRTTGQRMRIGALAVRILTPGVEFARNEMLAGGVPDDRGESFKRDGNRFPFTAADDIAGVIATDISDNEIAAERPALEVEYGSLAFAFEQIGCRVNAKTLAIKAHR